MIFIWEDGTLKFHNYFQPTLWYHIKATFRSNILSAVPLRFANHAKISNIYSSKTVNALINAFWKLSIMILVSWIQSKIMIFSWLVENSNPIQRLNSNRALKCENFENKRSTQNWIFHLTQKYFIFCLRHYDYVFTNIIQIYQGTILRILRFLLNDWVLNI